MSALLRASDAEREAVAAVLRRAHTDGRLDTAELEERIERCYAAKTQAELDALVADLPEPRRRRPRTRAPLGIAPQLLALVAFAAVVLAATHGYAFPIVPLLFFTFMRFGRRRSHPLR